LFEFDEAIPPRDSFSLLSDIIFSNLLDFFCHDHRVGLLDLLGAQLLVVKVAFMLITVSVYAAEQAAATASETCEPDFLLATLASILLLFAVFAVRGFVTGGSGGGGVS